MVNAVRVQAREEGGLRSLLLSGSRAWLPGGLQLLGARRAICAAQPVALGALSTPRGSGWVSGQPWPAPTPGLGKGGILSKAVACPFVPGWKISSRAARSCSGRAALGGTLPCPNTATCQFLPHTGAELRKVPVVERKKKTQPWQWGRGTSATVPWRRAGYRAALPQAGPHAAAVGCCCSQLPLT